MHHALPKDIVTAHFSQKPESKLNLQTTHSDGLLWQFVRHVNFVPHHVSCTDPVLLLHPLVTRFPPWIVPGT